MAISQRTLFGRRKVLLDKENSSDAIQYVWIDIPLEKKEQFLSEGGQGQIFKVFSQPGRENKQYPFVIKRLFNPGSNIDFETRCNQITIPARINYQQNNRKDVPVLVSPFAEEKDLWYFREKRYQEKNYFTVDELVDMFFRLTAQLARCHTLYIKGGLPFIHRDIKLENILIYLVDPHHIEEKKEDDFYSLAGVTFYPVLSDFGTALTYNPFSTSLFPYNDAGTTLQYFAPESITEEGKTVFGPKCDVYSLGMTFLLLLDPNDYFSEDIAKAVREHDGSREAALKLKAAISHPRKEALLRFQDQTDDIKIRGYIASLVDLMTKVDPDKRMDSVEAFTLAKKIKEYCVAIRKKSQDHIADIENELNRLIHHKKNGTAAEEKSKKQRPIPERKETSAITIKTTANTEVKKSSLVPLHPNDAHFRLHRKGLLTKTNYQEALTHSEFAKRVIDLDQAKILNKANLAHPNKWIFLINLKKEILNKKWNLSLCGGDWYNQEYCLPKTAYYIVLAIDKAFKSAQLDEAENQLNKIQELLTEALKPQTKFFNTGFFKRHHTTEQYYVNLKEIMSYLRSKQHSFSM